MYTGKLFEVYNKQTNESLRVTRTRVEAADCLEELDPEMTNPTIGIRYIGKL